MLPIIIMVAINVTYIEEKRMPVDESQDSHGRGLSGWKNATYLLSACQLKTFPGG